MPFNTRLTALAALLTLIYMVAYGVRRVEGVFFIHYQNEFHASAAEISAVISLAPTVTLMGGPFYGAFYKVAGIYVTFIVSCLFVSIGYIAVYFVQSQAGLIAFSSIIGGIGNGFIYVAIFSMVAKAFHKQRALVNNILPVGLSLFSLGVSTVIQSLIEMIGWRSVVLINGAFTLNVGPLGWMATNIYQKVVDSKTEKTLNGSKTSRRGSVINSSTSKFEVFKSSLSDAFDASLLRDPLFISYCVSSAFLLCARIAATIYLVRSAQAAGISDQKSASLLSVFFAASTPCCLIMGVVSYCMNKRAVNKSNSAYTFRASIAVIVVSFVQCVVFCIPLFDKSYITFVIYALLVSMCEGFIGSLPITVLSDFFGPERIAGALGFRALIMGSSLLLVPIFMGVLVDVFGNYDPVQYVCAGFMLCSAISLIIIQNRINARRRREILQSVSL